MKAKNKIKLEKFEIFLRIFFGDAKQSWERAMSVFSALFWTWLEFSFLKFLFVYIIGIAGYVSSGSIAYSWDMILQNTEFVNLFVKLSFILIFLLRIRIYHGKTIKIKEQQEK